jgi:hypothetical protein
MSRTATKPSRVLVPTLTGIGLAIGVIVAVIVNDVILGVIAGASFIAISVGLVRLWTGGDDQRSRHP